MPIMMQTGPPHAITETTIGVIIILISPSLFVSPLQQKSQEGGGKWAAGGREHGHLKGGEKVMVGGWTGGHTDEQA